MTGASEHVYGYPNEPNKGHIIVHPGERGQFGGATRGTIWCWRHGSWEDIPETWYAREEALRKEVTEEWRRIQSTEDWPALHADPLVSAIVKYGDHRGWRKPDPKNRHEIFRFFDWMEDGVPVR